jgi:hypothetical protein
MWATVSRPRWWDVLWLLCWGLVSSAWCLSAAARLGPTFDEPIYLARGLEHWRTGSAYPLLRLGTMPLPADVQTLPLYLAERWNGVPWDLGQDFELLLPWFRGGTLLFWWLLLVHAWLVGRQIAGPWGGGLIVALLACEPNLLGHACLGTTDIPLTACLLAFVYHYRNGRESGWLRRVGLPAVLFAATVLAKASGLVFAPICMLAVEVERLLRRTGQPTGEGWSRHEVRRGSLLRAPRWWTELRPWRRDSLATGLIGLALVFLWCGTDGHAEPSFVEWTQGLPEGRGKTALVWVAENLRVFSNAGEGLVRQIRHNLQGHGVFLLGKEDHRSLWYYFPLLLSIKLPLLPLLLLAVGVGRRGLRHWAAAVTAALLAFSFACRVQIGIRLLLPLVVLLWITLGATLVRTVAALGPGWRRRLLVGAASGAVVLMMSEALGIWPHGLAYVSPLWGGARDGYRLVSDSNYDWGQGVPELARWLSNGARRGGLPRRGDLSRATSCRGADLAVWYFGTDPLIHRLPVQETPLHQLPVAGWDDLYRHTRGRGLLAVSTTLVYGCCLNDDHRRAAELLRRLKPVDRTTTFLIYDLDREVAHAH